MAVPKYQECMLPLLRFAADGEEHSLAEGREAVADVLSLAEEDREELLPSGTQRRFDNNVSWAKVYLSGAGLLESTRRGHFRVTQRGRDVVASNPDSLRYTDLQKFDEFQKFRTRSHKPAEEEYGGVAPVVLQAEQTPQERIAEGYQELRATVADELLERVYACSPAAFERLVVQLLLRMGYGGSRKEAGRAIGRAGDGGIDGIINEDRLGLDVIYLQAKRYRGSVGRPEVQAFVGALEMRRARKGVLLTTGEFTRDAADYVGHIEKRVVLINGQDLAQFMIDHDVGVKVEQNLVLHRVDEDYFDEL